MICIAGKKFYNVVMSKSSSKSAECLMNDQLYYVSIEETFDVIKRAHIATGHDGRDRMVKHLAEKYASITKDALKLFKSYCEVCQEKIKRPVATGVVVRPIKSNEFNSRGQVELVDMQSKPCHSY